MPRKGTLAERRELIRLDTARCRLRKRIAEGKSPEPMTRHERAKIANAAGIAKRRAERERQKALTDNQQNAQPEAGGAC
jgi:hypothetical protein